MISLWQRRRKGGKQRAQEEASQREQYNTKEETEI
jgi:hypothetical protein